MNQPASSSPHQLMALVAIRCSVASIAIVALAFCLLRNLSGGGMWAVAAMASAPALLGTMVAYFISRHAKENFCSQD